MEDSLIEIKQEANDATHDIKEESSSATDINCQDFLCHEYINSDLNVNFSNDIRIKSDSETITTQEIDQTDEYFLPHFLVSH